MYILFEYLILLSYPLLFVGAITLVHHLIIIKSAIFLIYIINIAELSFLYNKFKLIPVMSITKLMSKINPQNVL